MAISSKNGNDCGFHCIEYLYRSLTLVYEYKEVAKATFERIIGFEHFGLSI